MQKAASQGTLGHTVQAVPCARRQGYCENANKNLAPVLKGRACDWSVPGRCAQTRWPAMGSSSAFGRGLRGSRLGLQVLGFLRLAVIQMAAATRVFGFLRLRALIFLRLGSLASCDSPSSRLPLRLGSLASCVSGPLISCDSGPWFPALMPSGLLGACVYKPLEIKHTANIAKPTGDACRSKKTTFNSTLKNLQTTPSSVTDAADILDRAFHPVQQMPTPTTQDAANHAYACGD
mmetsp:Transcript_31560/g.95394  ORF Transcript_31560/g.95394 Transcript_31560/m.95394 type:complete len:234 (+) Transcript_31560:214-915(+)